MTFNYKYLENQLKSAIDRGYMFLRCIDYAEGKFEAENKKVVLRIDIDFSVKKAKEMLNIFKYLNIKATFFIRLHAPEYNPFDFENYKIIKRAIKEGHEIGYHSEVIDQAAIWNENPESCLKRDIKILEDMFRIKVKGIASHGGMTGLNNLDFWKDKNASDFGLFYEAYDNKNLNLWNNSFYISDSEWTKWKSYDKGMLNEGDNRSFQEHLNDNHELIYLLIHSDTYYKNHFYE